MSDFYAGLDLLADVFPGTEATETTPTPLWNWWLTTLWPAPDGQALARMFAQAAPSLAAHLVLETMRRADEEARPLIDAVLDALGMLAGAASDADRALRPLAGLLADEPSVLREIGRKAEAAERRNELVEPLRRLDVRDAQPHVVDPPLGSHRPVMNSLSAVPVGIEEERREVRGGVVGAQPRRAVVAPPPLEAGGGEALHPVPLGRAEGHGRREDGQEGEVSGSARSATRTPGSAWPTSTRRSGNTMPRR